ncbi:histidine phosphatase family protein [Acidaminobacter hydrogenoformans]|uniref:Alpha-ribazole phosphatase n=1 Tax=Acidaminobacter hydrogenoformans DSM 2784 TaxID=1120920 RepID=A0A1G5S734_9FIRM|nr:histidine phosphatase family protein [Acidaminobacter hydrogenoformans]SCZ81947.1 alpha-ribazole phosphatase [Acidaminobacter hydrogenoformans DSM 2784]
MQIHLLRHGETEMNARGTFCGFSDPTLSEAGREQARHIAEEIRNYNYTRILVSPLKRAVETASIATGLEFEKFELHPDLREMNFGAWENLTYEEIMATGGAYAKAWEADNLNIPCLEGESMNTFHERVMKAYETLSADFKEDDRILIVSHAGVIRSFLTEWLHGSMEGYWRYKIDNCGHAIVEYIDGYAVLVQLKSPFPAPERSF